MPRQSRPQKVEDDMKRMSASELERRSEKERCVLFQTVSQTLIRTKGGSLLAGMPWGRVNTSAGYVSPDWPVDPR